MFKYLYDLYDLLKNFCQKSREEQQPPIDEPPSYLECQHNRQLYETYL